MPYRRSRHQPGTSSAASAVLSASASDAELSSRRSRVSQEAKLGTGDSVTKVESCGNSRLISSTTCLIRKLPNDTPASPRWQLEIE